MASDESQFLEILVKLDLFCDLLHLWNTIGGSRPSVKGGGGGHPDREIREVGLSPKFFFGSLGLSSL